MIDNNYKNTIVGVIPKDWTVIKLGDVFVFKNGLNKEKKYFGYGTPIVNYMDIFKNRGLKEKDIKGKVSLSKQEIKNYEVNKGDVFFTRTSETVEEIGITSVILEELKDTVFSGFILRARPKNIILDNIYKKYCFSTAQVRKEITSKSSYTTRALTNGRLLSNVNIAIPSMKEEQTAIAKILSDIDELITSLEKLISKKKMIKQGAMQQLLKPKKDWETKKMEDIAYIGRGRVISHREIESSIFNVYPVYSSQTSNNGIMGYINTYDFEGEYATWTTDGVNAGTVFYRNGKFNCTNVCGTIKIKKDNAMFVSLILNTITPQYVSKNLANPKLMNDIMKKIEIPLPLLNEQNDISQTLIDMEAEIETLEKKLDKYKMLKQGMMQVLLTGKIRLVKNKLNNL